MARFEGSMVINRPIEEVFAYVTDVSNSAPQWETGILEVEQTSEGPIGAGTTFQGVKRILGRRREWTLEVTEYEPSRKWRHKITSGGRTLVEETLTFEAVERGIRLTVASELKMGGFFRLASPIVVRKMQKEVEGDLANLKNILEAQA